MTAPDYEQSLKTTVSARMPTSLVKRRNEDEEQNRSKRITKLLAKGYKYENQNQ